MTSQPWTDWRAYGAWVISFIAMCVPILYAKYVVTAEDARRCSFRYMGRWGWRTRRECIFSNIRFEIKCSTPKFEVDVQPHRTYFTIQDGSGVERQAGVPMQSLQRQDEDSEKIHDQQQNLEVIQQRNPQAAQQQNLRPIQQQNPEAAQQQDFEAAQKQEGIQEQWIQQQERFVIGIHQREGQKQRVQKQGSIPKQYTFKPSQSSGRWWRIGFWKESEQHADASENPWFLRTPMEDTHSEGPGPITCWLALLRDTKSTNLRFRISEMVTTFDYNVDHLPRPLACADQKSFLTLMSLFRIRWVNKGVGADLEGKGDACEVSVKHEPGYGPVYAYRSLQQHDGTNTLGHQQYYIASETARLAMFNCFDLGFATFKTHDAAELEHSLHHALRNALGLVLSHDESEAANEVLGFYQGCNGWCPGLSESITCWAEPSMPKMVYLDKGKKKFKSVFSAVPARSLTTGCPRFVAMLAYACDETSSVAQSRRNIKSVRNIMEWAAEYLEQSDSQVKLMVIDCLKKAASWPLRGNNIVDPEIPWTHSEASLKAVHKLDEHLEVCLFKNVRDKETIKFAMSKRQIIHGCKLFKLATKASEIHRSGMWLDEVDRVGAEYYADIVAYLEKQLTEGQILDPSHNPQTFLLARRIIVNRLMRGSLWVIHNANAPDQNIRNLECSLSSQRILDSNPLIYIS